MRETHLLGHISARWAAQAARHPGVLVGPGDDCAVLRDGGPAPSAGTGLLVTVDHLVEGRHYAVGTPLELVARKALARSVSDIAAMAGTPAWSLATAALPPGYPDADAAELVDHLNRFAEHWGCPIVGGDVATTTDGAPVVLTVTVAGRAHATRGPVLRSAARPGDVCWMTGALGGSLPSGRHLTFEPRLAEARHLAGTLGERLHAMIDLSDGLGRDAARVAAASGARIVLEAPRFPLHPGADLATAAGDGEDYELFFTTAADAQLPPHCPATGTPYTRIGRVEVGAGCVIVDAHGREWDCTQLGWEH